MKLKISVSVLLVSGLMGCGVFIDPASYYLKRAEVMLKKAEQHGAEITPDSVKGVLKLKLPGREVVFDHVRVTAYDTMTMFKDSVVTTFVMMPSKAQSSKPEPCADSVVYMATDCPDETVEAEYTTAVSNNIDSGRSKVDWWWIPICVAGTALTLLVLLLKWKSQRS